jgi:Flp pilus assembly protein TadD
MTTRTGSRLADSRATMARASVCLVALAITGCMTTGTTGSPGATARQTPPARIDLDESVGFTITEDARISSATRSDYDAALDLLERGEREQGIAMLRQVVDASPGLSAPRIDLGIAYHAAGDLESAEAELLEALAINPDHPVVHNELGIIYRKTGRFDEARSSYEAALAVYSGYHFARRNLAVLCDLYLGDLDCALENYEAYMQTVPGDDEATIWIADLKSRMARRDAP